MNQYYIPINKISEDYSNKIRIRGRILYIHHFKMGNGMSLKIRDDNTTPNNIHVLFWNETYKTYRQFFRVGSWYQFSRFQISRFTNPRYNYTNHQFKIIISTNSNIRKIRPENKIMIKGRQYSCIKLKNKTRTCKIKIDKSTKKYYNIKLNHRDIRDYFEQNNQDKGKSIETQTIEQRNVDNIIKPNSSTRQQKTKVHQITILNYFGCNSINFE